MPDARFSIRSLLVAELEPRLGTLGPGQVIAVRLRPGDAHGVKGEEFDGLGARVVFCPSNLAIRREMADHEEEASEADLVILTDRDESDLEEDLFARFAGRRLLRLDPWHAVAQLFKVSPEGLDPRLRKKAWMAARLIDLAPREGYAAVPSGVLSLERAYHELLRAGFGFEETRPDLVAILRWGEDEAARMRLAEAPEDQRSDVVAWIVESAGATAEPLLSMALGSRGRDAVAFGLALDVLRHPSIEGTKEQQAAVIRTEPLLQGRQLQPSELSAWADAARRVLDEQTPDARAKNLARGDAILEELKASDFGRLSDLLPSGLDGRARAYAGAIEAFLDSPAKGTDEARQRLTSLEAHALSTTVNGDGDVPRMAFRLVRWLALVREKEVPSYLAELARLEHDVGGFVELARERLSRGHGSPVLLAAFQRLIGEVLRRRDVEALAFAKRLAEATALGKLPAGVMGVEKVLDRVILPLAAKDPVLLLVLDGASCSQLAEMGRELEAEGFAFCGSAEGEAPVVLAALPSLTEVSRSSLLSGRRVRGQQAAEKKAFAQHEGLVAASKKTKPPVLFHKKDLSEEGSQHLANDVREVLADPSRQVVGLVINAIDDHLMKGDQVPIQWSLNQVLHLRAVLESARDAGRAIVLTADHGHVLDRNMEKIGRQGENVRWRSALGGDLEDGEVLVEGSRVLTGDGKAILMASPRKRYSGKPQNGYHGGISPQEVVVPFAVLVSGGRVPEGMREIGFSEPEFWSTGSDVVARPKPTVVKKKVEVPEGYLPFGDEEVVEVEAEAGRADWVQKLLESELYQAQEKRWKRMAPPADRVRRALDALASRGGTMTAAALARALDMPLPRLGRFGAAMQKVLNLDGVFVVEFDTASESWKLDEVLARKQFLE
jgi:PglZ domain